MIEPDGSTPGRAGRPRSGRATGSGSAPASGSRSTATVVAGPVERRPEGDHRASRCPVVREPGDAVFAGTVNGEGALEVEASGPLGDALISRIVAQVREAQAGRAPVERRIARFAAVLHARSWWPSRWLVMLVPPLVRLASGGAAGAADLARLVLRRGWSCW